VHGFVIGAQPGEVAADHLGCDFTHVNFAGVVDPVLLGNISNLLLCCTYESNLRDYSASDRSPIHSIRTKSFTCAGYLTHPSDVSVRMRTCCLHPNGIPYYLIFYFLDIGQNILDSTTKCTPEGRNSILDRVSGITLSLGRFLPSQWFVDSNLGPDVLCWNPVIGDLESRADL